MFLLLLAALILCAPVRAEVTLGTRPRPAGELLVRLWEIPLRLRFHFQGMQLVLEGRRPPPMTPRQDRMRRWLAMTGTLLRSGHARRILTGGVQLQLRIHVHLGLSDAAKTALYTGMVRSLQALLPPRWRRTCCLRIRPDFLHEDTALHLRCILLTHLGTLVITAAMALTAWLLEKQEHSRRPKEESA